MNLATDLYPKYDCIVVGGGIAGIIMIKNSKQRLNNKFQIFPTGLVATYEIYKRDPSLQIRILEAGNRIGGQILSDVIGELGARWISEDQSHILKLCNELNVQIFTNVEEKDYKNISDLDKDAFLSSFAKFELKRFFSMIDVICQDSRYESKIWKILITNQHVYPIYNVHLLRLYI